MSAFSYKGFIKDNAHLLNAVVGCLPFVHSYNLFKKRDYAGAAFWGLIDAAVLAPFSLPFANIILKSISINSKLLSTSVNACRLIKLSRTVRNPVVIRAIDKFRWQMNAHELCKPFAYATLSEKELKLCAGKIWHASMRSGHGMKAGYLFLNP